MVTKAKKKPPKKKAPTRRPGRPAKDKLQAAEAAAPDAAGAPGDSAEYDGLTAYQKRAVQQVFRLWLRHYTLEQVVEMLASGKDAIRISRSTAWRYLQVGKRCAAACCEKLSLADLLDEEVLRFEEILSTLWNDHAQAPPGGNARVGFMNAIIAGESRLAEIRGLTVNRLKIDADVNGRVVGTLDLDFGEETLSQIDALVEKVIIAQQSKPAAVA
jgi:hypothetical protein